MLELYNKINWGKMYIGTDEEIIEYEHQTMKTTAKSTELFLLIRIKKKNKEECLQS